MSADILLDGTYNRLSARILPPNYDRDFGRQPQGVEVESLRSEPAEPLMEVILNKPVIMQSASRDIYLYLKVLVSAGAYLIGSAIAIIVGLIGFVSNYYIFVGPSIVFFVTLATLGLIRLSESLKLHVQLSEQPVGGMQGWRHGKFRL